MRSFRGLALCFAVSVSTALCAVPAASAQEVVPTDATLADGAVTTTSAPAAPTDAAPTSEPEPLPVWLPGVDEQPVIKQAFAANTIAQGELVEFFSDQGTFSCTAGFNDRVAHRTYFAAHCIEDLVSQDFGIIVGEGAEIKHAGTAYISPGFKRYTEDFVSLNDWGYVDWNEDVSLSYNRLTGDTKLSMDSLEVGERICYHGGVTHGNADTMTCGTVAFVHGESVWMDFAGGEPVLGDSGGPVWIPGRGFVGVLSQKRPYPVPTSQRWLVAASAIDRDGELLGDCEVLRDFGSYFMSSGEGLAEPGTPCVSATIAGNALGVLGVPETSSIEGENSSVPLWTTRANLATWLGIWGLGIGTFSALAWGVLAAIETFTGTNALRLGSSFIG